MSFPWRITLEGENPWSLGPGRELVLVDREGFMPPARFAPCGFVVAGGHEYAVGWGQPHEGRRFGAVVRLRSRGRFRVGRREREALMWFVADPLAVVRSGTFDEPGHNTTVVGVRAG